MSRVGVDIDDVLMPWAETAHGLCEAAGITNGASVTRWEFWKDYGCEPQAVWDVLNDATLRGGLYDVPPYAEAWFALERLHMEGHSIHLVTARGFHGPHRELIRLLTVKWLREWTIPHDSLTFSMDKTVVGSDFFIDDSLRNYDALEAAGVSVFLLNRPHNQVDDGVYRHRVNTLHEFVDIAVREAAA